MKTKITCILLFAVSFPSYAAQETIERTLNLIQQVYELESKDCNKLQVVNPNEKKIRAGEILFTSTLLSGNRDISCKACHLDKFDSTDGLPLAVGVGGQGEGNYRLEHGEGVMVQRNALSLVGRGTAHFTKFFWDGKVDKADTGEIVSQFGDRLSEKFESPLAVASMLPIIERDEFIGVRRFRENDIQREVGDSLYQERYVSVSKVLRKRILSGEDNNEIRDALLEARVEVKSLELADIGNVISHFVADKFRCKKSRWDAYIEGDKKALSISEKRGAILFYGKGRCASCHSGPVHSDFRFHSIGTPQGLFGPHPRHRDLGRAAVTFRQGDLYKFRTPPLIEVAKTAPYGHNGIFESLRDVVIHHLNPIQFYLDHPKLARDTLLETGRTIDSRDKVLSSIGIRSDQELDDLISFLKVL